MFRAYKNLSDWWLKDQSYYDRISRTAEKSMSPQVNHKILPVSILLALGFRLRMTALCQRWWMNIILYPRVETLGYPWFVPMGLFHNRLYELCSGESTFALSEKIPSIIKNMYIVKIAVFLFYRSIFILLAKRLLSKWWLWASAGEWILILDPRVETLGYPWFFPMGLFHNRIYNRCRGESTFALSEKIPSQPFGHKGSHWFLYKFLNIPVFSLD